MSRISACYVRTDTVATAPSRESSAVCIPLDDHDAHIVDGRREGQEILDDGVVDRFSGVMFRAPDGVLEAQGNVGIAAAAVFGESVRSTRPTFSLVKILACSSSDVCPTGVPQKQRSGCGTLQGGCDREVGREREHTAFVPFTGHAQPETLIASGGTPSGWYG